MDTLTLLIPVFVAGLLTFFAPCTFPLIPGYIGFISGASLQDFKDSERLNKIKKRVLLNAVLYIVGFSAVFILLGVLFGLGGAVLVQYRVLLSRVGGIFVLLFGLHMTGLLRISALNRERRFHVSRIFVPGNPLSSFAFGATFAFGWTPCIGPILGTVLFLASHTATVGNGALLLAVFSLGLAVPFLILALGISHATASIKALSKYIPVLSIFGGFLIIILGILLVTDSFSLWVSWFYRLFSFFQFDGFLKFM